MGFLDKLFGKKKEVSPGGSQIYRYPSQNDRKRQLPETSEIYLEEIESHFDSLFPGRERFVYHELISDIVHIDVHIMKPTEAEPFYVVFTTGMSDRPMTVTPDVPREKQLDYELAELFMFLPGSWDMGGEGKSTADIHPAHFWPIRMIKFLARFPHEYRTWLGYGHTIPNGPDYSPVDDSVNFGGAVLSGGTGPLCSMTAKNGRKINFYHLIPAYKEEIEYKLKYGMSALEKIFQEKELPLVLNPHRPNLCPNFKEVLDG